MVIATWPLAAPTQAVDCEATAAELSAAYAKLSPSGKWPADNLRDRSTKERVRFFDRPPFVTFSRFSFSTILRCDLFAEAGPLGLINVPVITVRRRPRTRCVLCARIRFEEINRRM